MVNQFGKPVVNILSQNELTNNPLNLIGFKNGIYFSTLSADVLAQLKRLLSNNLNYITIQKIF